MEVVKLILLIILYHRVDLQFYLQMLLSCSKLLLLPTV